MFQPAVPTISTSNGSCSFQRKSHQIFTKFEKRVTAPNSSCSVDQSVYFLGLVTFLIDVVFRKVKDHLKLSLHTVLYISCCYQKGLGPQTVTTYISVSINAFSYVRNQTFEVSRIIQEFQKLKQSVDVCTLITLSILQK